jgi:hypothetical protein
MDDVAGQVPSTGGDISTGPPPRGRAASQAPGCLRVVGTLGLVLAGLAALTFVALFISLQQGFKAPEAVPAPVVWTSRDVVLSPDRPVVRGRLTLTAGPAPQSALRVGLNAGVPSTDRELSSPGSGAASPSGSAQPAALISGPAVRLTATVASGAPRSCLAPCELELASALDCDSGTCRIDFDVTVELISDGAAALGGSVTVGVSGGATGPLDKRLPDGLVVDLAIEGAIVPRGS